MGVNVSAYVERKGADGKWELMTAKAVCSNLKYVIEDYNELPRVEWDELSDGLKERFTMEKDDTTGEARCYANFYSTTLQDLENELSKRTRETFVRINTIVTALGAARIYNDDGEEMDWGGEADESSNLTIPVRKTLIEDLQLAYATIRQIRLQEAFDLFVSEHIAYGDESRIILVVC
jgi:hypothetical protein